MWGSCCIEALDEIVLKLTPPRDPVEVRKKLMQAKVFHPNHLIIHYLEVYIKKPSHHHFQRSVWKR
jgi:hypothetical protein